jgi:hypothetical protein
MTKLPPEELSKSLKFEGPEHVIFLSTLEK